ncbi:hypothetical protein D3C71_79510 [compost metagenome]
MSRPGGLFRPFRKLLVMDYLKPPEAIITDLINRTNGTTLASSQLAYGVPFLPTADDDAPRNTLLTVGAADGSAFTGSVVLEYDRIPLKMLANGRPAMFFRSTATRVSELLPQINARFGVQIGIADIIDGDLPPANEDGTVTGFVLVASPHALVWQDNDTFVLAEGEMPTNVRGTTNGAFRVTMDAKFRTVSPPV